MTIISGLPQCLSQGEEWITFEFVKAANLLVNNIVFCYFCCRYHNRVYNCYNNGNREGSDLPGEPLVPLPVPSNSLLLNTEQVVWKKQIKWRTFFSQLPWSCCAIQPHMLLLLDVSWYASVTQPWCCLLPNKDRETLILGKLFPQESQWPVRSLSHLLSPAAPAIKYNGREPRICLFWCKSPWLPEGIDLTRFPFIWQATLSSFADCFCLLKSHPFMKFVDLNFFYLIQKYRSCNSLKHTCM